MRPDAMPTWACALAVGCLAGRELGSVVPMSVFLAGELAAAVALLVLRQRPLARVLAIVAVLAVGFGGAAARTQLLDDGLLAQLARHGGAFEVSAVVVTEPRVGENGWWTIVRVDRVADRPIRERALLRGDGPAPTLGSRRSGRVTARPLGREGFERYVRSLHAGVALDPRTWVAMERAGSLYRSTERVRERVRDSFADSLSPPKAGLAVGLVTGDTRQLPPAVEEEMRATGLTHLVAVSGSNVAIVAAGAVLFAGVLGAGARTRRWIVALVIVWFAVLTRFEPSVVRAVVMALLLLAGQARGVIVDPVRSLAVTVVLLLLLDPLLAGSLGLVLSAVATAGVLVVAPAARRRLAFLPRRTADLLAVTLGAQIAVAPVLLATQGEVPLSSVPANLVAVPAAAAASTVSGLAALLAQLDAGSGSLLVRLADPALATILWVAEHGQDRLGVLALERPLALLLFGAGCTWLVAARGSRLARRAGGLAVLATVGSVVPWVGMRAPVRTLTVTAIDVGQGDAILVETPGAAMLVDGGEDGRAAAWLRRQGKRQLDLVVVSHAHADHVGGLADVLRQSAVGSVWHHPVPFDSPPLEEALGVARSAGTPVHEPRTGQRAALGDLELEVLSPPPGRAFRWSDSEPNDASVVLRARWGSRVALLTGDAEVPAQDEMLRRGTDLRAGLLKVPHHGGDTSTERFLAATQARVAVISAGVDNRYGHPHPDVLATLEGHGMVVRRTDVEGTIRIEVPPPDGEAGASVRRGVRVASGHAARVSHHRLRRAPRPALAASPAREAPGRGTGSGRRDRRRLGGRSPP